MSRAPAIFSDQISGGEGGGYFYRRFDFIGDTSGETLGWVFVVNNPPNAPEPPRGLRVNTEFWTFNRDLEVKFRVVLNDQPKEWPAQWPPAGAPTPAPHAWTWQVPREPREYHPNEADATPDVNYYSLSQGRGHLHTWGLRYPSQHQPVGRLEFWSSKDERAFDGQLHEAWHYQFASPQPRRLAGYEASSDVALTSS